MKMIRESRKEYKVGMYKSTSKIVESINIWLNALRLVYKIGITPFKYKFHEVNNFTLTSPF
ncbi:hypothetical protein ACFQ3N_15600 [Virgibacillus byunsanensis]|uniref:Transposase n=1 Tax=Virgibacillus byunsanensis TaxID=570945 RepID=A0ABW3LN45_9BACI